MKTVFIFHQEHKVCGILSLQFYSYMLMLDLSLVYYACKVLVEIHFKMLVYCIQK